MSLTVSGRTGFRLAYGIPDGAGSPTIRYWHYCNLRRSHPPACIPATCSGAVAGASGPRRNRPPERIPDPPTCYARTDIRHWADPSTVFPENPADRFSTHAGRERFRDGRY